MATIKELESLYNQGKYREVVEAAESDAGQTQKKRLRLAWAHHQLGEYDRSMDIAEALREHCPGSSAIGESARRCLAHSWLQNGGDVGYADNILCELPVGLPCDNVRMNIFLIAARKGVKIPARMVVMMVLSAIVIVPYETVNGHIINNGALAIYEAREQEQVVPYLAILPGLIDMTIRIYEATGTAKNHIAGAWFRASQILGDVAGRRREALGAISNSIRLWEELKAEQGGDRFGKNLDGAQEQRRRLAC